VSAANYSSLLVSDIVSDRRTLVRKTDETLFASHDRGITSRRTLLVSGVYSATLAIVGRFWVNISYNIGLQYAAEVLPTVVRAQGVALIHIMGYVASILAPFVVYLDIVSPILPLLVLGVMGVLGGLLTLFLPETLDKDLPQTLQDGEDFGKDQKMWDMPCLSK